MKKLLIVLGLLTLIILSCRKEVNTKVKQQLQQHPVCGTVATMAGLSPETKNQMYRTAIQAPALLVFLDFDGALVRRGNPSPIGYVSPIILHAQAFCPPSPLTPIQKEEVVKLVEDDFSPFKIQITTDQSIFDSYEAPYKHICIVTTVPSVIGHPFFEGGVAPFAGPGIRLPFNPSFVFSQLYGSAIRDIALVISQEVSHTFGLEHQHVFDKDCNFITEYHPGFGSGPLSFTPIMGAGYNKRISNWYGQSCEEQDDFQLLNDIVELREDDFPDVLAGNDFITSGLVDGILEKQNDVDYIPINFQAPGSVTIASENIDIKASLVTPGGHLLSEYNDPNDTHLTIPVAKGFAFLKIEAASNANMSSQFMTGRYKVVF